MRTGSAPELGHQLARVLPEDTFAQVCGLGGLVVEVCLAESAAFWRGSPWGTGWTGGGDPPQLQQLVDDLRPEEITVPATTGLPRGYREVWGWGWHASTTPPPVQPGEDAVDWRPQDPRLDALLATAFPDAETPPGDPRVARWFGAVADGRLVAAAAELHVDPAVAMLSSLAVDPAARRAGWGAAVTAWFVRRRLSEGARVVGLGTYLTNTGARTLYDRLGFADVPYVGGVREV